MKFASRCPGPYGGSDHMALLRVPGEDVAGIVDISSYPNLRNAPIIMATCRYPAGPGKHYPVVITFREGTSRFQYTAPYGIGTCSYTPMAVQPDSGGANLSSYLTGLVNQGNWRKPSDPGSLVAWGWGISRLIDAFANDPDFDSDKVAVEGHSRYGKATLVTGAYDERVVVTWPSDSGAMGAAMMRRSYGETLDFVVMVGDGKLPSHDAVVTITIPDKLNLCHNAHTISVSKNAVSAHIALGDTVGSCSE